MQGKELVTSLSTSWTPQPFLSPVSDENVCDNDTGTEQVVGTGTTWACSKFGVTKLTWIAWDTLTGKRLIVEPSDHNADSFSSAATQCLGDGTRSTLLQQS